MKQAIRSALPTDWINEIRGARFIVTQLDEFGPAKLIGFGDDPIELARLPGTLYRVDEAKRSE